MHRHLLQDEDDKKNDKDTESDKNGDFNSNFQQREHLRTATFSKPPVFAAQLEVEPKPK